MNIAGTFCYKRRTPPAMGEGLALEEARVKPSRGSFRFLAEREETLKSGGDVLGASSPPPVPASMAKTSIENDDEFEEDMNEDVMVLTKMLRGNYLDVQADAAMAVAGLTADRESRTNYLFRLFLYMSESLAHAVVHARIHPTQFQPSAEVLTQRSFSAQTECLTFYSLFYPFAALPWSSSPPPINPQPDSCAGFAGTKPLRPPAPCASLPLACLWKPLTVPPVDRRRWWWRTSALRASSAPRFWPPTLLSRHAHRRHG